MDHCFEKAIVACQRLSAVLSVQTQYISMDPIGHDPLDDMQNQKNEKNIARKGEEIEEVVNNLYCSPLI